MGRRGVAAPDQRRSPSVNRKRQRERGSSSSSSPSPQPEGPGARKATGRPVGHDGKEWKNAKTLKQARAQAFSSELGYTNENNPFGDSALLERFVWKKKDEIMSAAGAYKKPTKRSVMDKTEQKLHEVISVKKRREEREEELMLLEEQRDERERAQMAEEFEEREEQVEEFNRKQNLLRAELRIKDGRETPLDLIVKGLRILDGEKFDDNAVLDKPLWELTPLMPLKDLEQLEEEASSFLNTGRHARFWKALNECVRDDLHTRQGKKNKKTDGINASVLSDVTELLNNKGITELEKMGKEIQSMMDDTDGGVDVQFYEAVLAKLPLFKARAVVTAMHEEVQSVVAPLRAVQKKAGKSWEEVLAEEEEEKPGPSPGPSPAPSDDGPGPSPSPSEEYGDGSMSPVLNPLHRFKDEVIIDEVDEAAERLRIRASLLAQYRGEDDDFSKEKAKGFANDEGVLGDTDEVSLKKKYEWEAKYKPRKPRFFNRVKCGFEWNKYNQTHYDRETPPPKFVQGYKFNIFYPDLIDKSKPPRYLLEKSDTPETVILRFTAGPPYEDVAFKILDKEWQLQARHGFRSSFERGVLQLYVNFKRWRYRR
jgi:hypothetical protein